VVYRSDDSDKREEREKRGERVRVFYLWDSNK
jgi:hypothetical protein